MIEFNPTRKSTGGRMAVGCQKQSLKLRTEETFLYEAGNENVHRLSLPNVQTLIENVDCI